MSKKKTSQSKTAKSQPSVSFSPTYHLGNYQGEDQHHTALIKQGEKLLEILYFEELGVKRIIAPREDMRYFREIANSDLDPTRIKEAAEYYLKQSPLTGLKREMTAKARGVLSEMLNL